MAILTERAQNTSLNPQKSLRCRIVDRVQKLCGNPVASATLDVDGQYLGRSVEEAEALQAGVGEDESIQALAPLAQAHPTARHRHGRGPSKPRTHATR